MKTCTRCDTPKALEAFPKRKTSKDGRDAWCRACKKAYNGHYYSKNQTAILEQKRGYWASNKENLKPKNRARWARNNVQYGQVAKRWREENREVLLSYFRQKRQDHTTQLEVLKDFPCLDCGVSYPSFVMEFDHVRGTKRWALGKMSNHSPSAIEAELKKCDLVCCACHRIRTQLRKGASTNPKVVEFRQWLSELKANPCMDCEKILHHVAMDFDHVRGIKVAGISQMWSWGREKVIVEIAKCELVCANCHRIRTVQRQMRMVA